MSDSVVRAGELAARLEAAADALLMEVASLPSDLITWKPADDVWSVMEILGHVSEFVPFWTSQTIQVVRRPDEEWGRTHTDTARLDAVQGAGSRSLAELTTAIRNGVQNSVSEIRELRSADLEIEAMSRNPRWARKPAAFIIEHLLVEHVEKHLSQIRRNVKQFDERGSSSLSTA